MLVLGWLVFLPLLVHLAGFRLQIFSWLFVGLYVISYLSSLFLDLSVGYSFETLELSAIVTKMRRYVESNWAFRYGSVKYYFGDAGRVHYLMYCLVHI